MVLRADPQVLPDGGITAGKLCIGVDVGGTFTDVVRSAGNRVWRAKAAPLRGSIRSDCCASGRARRAPIRALRAMDEAAPNPP